MHHHTVERCSELRRDVHATHLVLVEVDKSLLLDFLGGCVGFKAPRHVVVEVEHLVRWNTRQIRTLQCKQERTMKVTTTILQHTQAHTDTF